MSKLLAIEQFIKEVREDCTSPATSGFSKLIPLCRQTVAELEETLDADREALMKLKKSLKSVHTSGITLCDHELNMSRILDKLGENAEINDNDFEIGAAFKKFAIVTKELSNLMETLMQSMKNIALFPLDSILKGDIKGVKGDLKRPFDKAFREFESKLAKLEKERKAHAKESGLTKPELSLTMGSEDLNKERKFFQLQMCEYLIKVNEIKTKKEIDLLTHLIDYYHAQASYFQDGLKTIEYFNFYVGELALKLTSIKQRRDEERKSLIELRNLIKSYCPSTEGGPSSSSSKEPSTPGSGNVVNSGGGGSVGFVGSVGSSGPTISGQPGSSTVDRRESRGGYSLHQIQGNKNYGVYKIGYLMKKSEGKMKVKVWLKRKCEIKDGFLYIHHSDASKTPTKVNLLTCQVKPVADEKKAFDLVSCNRTYHFQADDEAECEAWISVLLNSKEGALKKEFDACNNSGSMGGKMSTSSTASRTTGYALQSLIELRQSVINQVLKLPGNDKCADCNSSNDPTWLSTNLGILLCIECSGIHRDLGVHISRIQSLTLDNLGTSQLLLARFMSNSAFNEIMEALLEPSVKLNPNSSMENRFEFIRAKYVDKKYAVRSCSGDIDDLRNDLEQAILSGNIQQVLEVFAEGGDLNWVLPSYTANSETGLHVAISREEGSTLHIVDFLVQNNPDLNVSNRTGDTPLHYTVRYNQTECMKLLLRSGANIKAKNNDSKTPLQMAKERGSLKLVELLEHAMANKKYLFEHVNIDWGLSGLQSDDMLTDFSDEETLEDKQQSQEQSSSYPMPGHSINSRPPSVARSESPTLVGQHPGQQAEIVRPGRRLIGSLFGNSGSMKKKAPKGPAPGKSTKPSLSEDKTSGISFNSPSFMSSEATGAVGGAAAAPLTPPSPTSTGPFGESSRMSISRAGRFYLHSRATSDTSALIKKVSQWKDVSAELEGSFKNIPLSESKIPSSFKPPPPPSTISTFQSPCRPSGPPPLPPHRGFMYGSSGNLRDLETKANVKLGSQQQSKLTRQRLSNGQSLEQIASASSSQEPSRVQRHLPIPPPRKQRSDVPSMRVRRCRALYDCEAERNDELTFREGEIILIINEKTDDEDWMEGIIEDDPERKGVFPTSFVEILNE